MYEELRKAFIKRPTQEVSAAVKAFIATDEKGFPPHIGAIKAQISGFDDTFAVDASNSRVEVEIEEIDETE